MDNVTTFGIQDVVNFCKPFSLYSATCRNRLLPTINACIFPDDENYQFLVRCSLKPLCVPCYKDIPITFDDDPVARQAIEGKINFITFRHIAENRDALNFCPQLTTVGWDAFNLLKDIRVRAFLDMIAEAEGWFYDENKNIHRPTKYEEISGWQPITDISDHPHKKGKWSSAAGPYQFMPGDWDTAKKDTGLTDFTPQSQDIAAVHLLRTRNRIMEAILADDILEAIQRASGTWASLPDKNNSKNGDVNNFPASHYKGQHAAPANELFKFYSNALNSLKTIK